MKAVSIKQPWAHLIASGIKDIENRTWRTNFRCRIYIHASAKIVYYKELSLVQLRLLQENNVETLGDVLERRFITSAIIGEVDIVDCVINHPSIWAEKTFIDKATESNPDVEDGKPIWNWGLANPVLFKNPILNVKGKLSFWEYNI